MNKKKGSLPDLVRLKLSPMEEEKENRREEAESPAKKEGGEEAPSEPPPDAAEVGFAKEQLEALALDLSIFTEKLQEYSSKVKALKAVKVLKEKKADNAITEELIKEVIKPALVDTKVFLRILDDPFLSHRFLK